MRYSMLKLGDRRYAVVDSKVDRVICWCEGWYGSQQAEQITKALNESDVKLFHKLGLELKVES